MNKIIIILIVMCIAAPNIFAQDIIILKNGNELKGKVIEITFAEIKVQQEFYDMGVISLASELVYAIKYENGTVDIINHNITSRSDTTIDSTSNNVRKRKWRKGSSSLLAGVSFPLGQFNDSDKGAAKRGFTASVELIIKTKLPILSFECQGNYTTHTLKIDNPSLNKYIQGRYDLGNLLLGYRLHTQSKKFNAFVSAVAGLNYTAVDGKSPGTINGVGFAFYPGAGIVFKKLTIATRYLIANPSVVPYSQGELLNVRTFQILAGIQLK